MAVVWHGGLATTSEVMPKLLVHEEWLQANTLWQRTNIKAAYVRNNVAHNTRISSAGRALCRYLRPIEPLHFTGCRSTGPARQTPQHVTRTARNGIHANTRHMLRCSQQPQQCTRISAYLTRQLPSRRVHGPTSTAGHRASIGKGQRCPGNAQCSRLLAPCRTQQLQRYLAMRLLCPAQPSDRSIRQGTPFTAVRTQVIPFAPHPAPGAAPLTARPPRAQPLGAVLASGCAACTALKRLQSRLEAVQLTHRATCTW